MGGPGSGKGTQCARLVERYGMVHLSAGDLLREEVASGSALGNEISAIIREGQIVKSETTVALLRSAMSGRDGPFLIDGFPRSISNLEAFEAEMGQAAFMLFLEVSEAQMEKRLLNRGRTSGRSDDNRDTITKRFRTFVCDSMPVIDALRERDCVRFVDAGGSPDEVFASVCEAFADQQLDE
jgi:adenylate kinase family enzyme